MRLHVKDSSSLESVALRRELSGKLQKQRGELIFVLFCFSARCKACKMSVHHKCRDNVPYCPGERVSIVQWDSFSRRLFNA